MLAHPIPTGGWLRCRSVPTDAPVRPAYGGGCVADVVPALTGRTDRAGLPEPARDATSVVLLVLDGLGWELVQAHRAALPRALGPHRRRDHDRGAVDDRVGPDVDHHRSRAHPARRARVPHPGRRRDPERAALDRRPGSGAGSVPRAASPSVPRAHGAGGDAPRVPPVGIHRRAPARRALPRVEHDRGARRALPGPRRAGRAGRLRVLPGRRHRGARVRPARSVPASASSRSPTS